MLTPEQIEAIEDYTDWAAQQTRDGLEAGPRAYEKHVLAEAAPEALADVHGAVRDAIEARRKALEHLNRGEVEGAKVVVGGMLTHLADIIAVANPYVPEHERLALSA
jgi:hypothetical protein